MVLMAEAPTLGNTMEILVGFCILGPGALLSEGRLTQLTPDAFEDPSWVKPTKEAAVTVKGAIAITTAAAVKQRANGRRIIFEVISFFSFG